MAATTATGSGTPKPQGPFFPMNTKYEYLAEGAANVVYRIAVLPGTPPPSDIDTYDAADESNDDEIEKATLPADLDLTTSWLQPFQHKLLRVRKDLPTTVPCETSHDAWLRVFAPLFPPEQLVQQSLVELRPGNTIAQLNTQLRAWDYASQRGSPSVSPRPAKRKGVYLADDEHGLLIQDMTSHGPNETVMEFKPKWLAQSPSAPRDARRCRQCARFARVNAGHARRNEARVNSYCPLDLVSDSPTERLAAARQMLASISPSPAAMARFAHWLETNTLLPRLQKYQSQLDKKGPLAGDVQDSDFLTIMTLRDCTVFLRFHGDGTDTSTKIEARIGDLDLKSPDKKQYWYQTELQLIEEGWYHGCEDPSDAQPLDCRISRGFKGGDR